jgi:hypothetical protein
MVSVEDWSWLGFWWDCARVDSAWPEIRKRNSIRDRAYFPLPVLSVSVVPTLLLASFSMYLSSTTTRITVSIRRFHGIQLLDLSAWALEHLHWHSVNSFVRHTQAINRRGRVRCYCSYAQSVLQNNEGSEIKLTSSGDNQCLWKQGDATTKGQPGFADGARWIEYLAREEYYY